MSKVTFTAPPPAPPPMFHITLTLLEAQELRAALGAVYGLETDVENRLFDALAESGHDTYGPFENCKDEDGDTCVRRRRA